METTLIDPALLKRAAKIAIEAVGKNALYESNRDFLLLEKDGKLWGGDGEELWICTETPIRPPDNYLPHAQRFNATIQNAPGDIEFEFGGTITIKTGQYGRYQISCGDPKTYVVPLATSFEQVGTLDIGALVEVFPFISGALSTNVTKEALRFVYLDAEEQRIVATDGLFFATAPLPERISESLLVHPRAFSALVHSGADGCKVLVSEPLIRLEAPGVTVYSRRLDSPYPNYAPVLKRGFEKPTGVVDVDRKEFLNIIKRVGAFASKMEVYSRIIIKLSEGGCYASAEDKETNGKARDLIPGDYAGEDAVIYSLPQNLHQFVRDFPSENVCLTLSEDRRRLRAEGDDTLGLLLLERPPSQ